jgi:hypothetical protein
MPKKKNRPRYRHRGVPRPRLAQALVVECDDPRCGAAHGQVLTTLPPWLRP